MNQINVLVINKWTNNNAFQKILTRNFLTIKFQKLYIYITNDILANMKWNCWILFYTISKSIFVLGLVD